MGSCGKMNYMFGKKKGSGYLPSPDDLANEFGRRTLFGRSYFGRYPMFGKKKRVTPPPEMGGDNEFGRYVRYGRRRTSFGSKAHPSKCRIAYNKCKAAKKAAKASSFGRHRRRHHRRHRRKGLGRKPPARVRKMCRKYKIKCTREVGRRRVYKSLTVLKRQLRRKMKTHRKVHRKGGRKVRKARRKTRKVRRTRY